MNRIQSIEIAKRKIHLYSPETGSYPAIVIPADDSDGSLIYQECLENGNKDFILIVISNVDWNCELSPWQAPPVFRKGESFLGEADLYLKEIEEVLLPEIRQYLSDQNLLIQSYALAGYSLAGLFSLYAGFQTSIFETIASVSGSLWYPNFSTYVENHRLSSNIRKIYFSLGNKEAETKNPLMSTVKDKTLQIREYLSSYIETFYEENEGNHFQEPEKRMAKAIRYLLNQ